MLTLTLTLSFCSLFSKLGSASPNSSRLLETQEGQVLSEGARNGSERALAKVKAARGRCQPMMLGAFEHMKDWKIEEEEEENFPSRLQPL